jgi:hypothetical protein
MAERTREIYGYDGASPSGLLLLFPIVLLSYTLGTHCRQFLILAAEESGKDEERDDGDRVGADVVDIQGAGIQSVSRRRKMLGRHGIERELSDAETGVEGDPPTYPFAY